MALNPAARLLYLRFVGGGIAADAGAYGTGLYGDSQTYGQEAGESATTGIRYELMPFPGWHPGVGAWVFRVGDTEEPFIGVVADYSDPTDRLDLSSVQDAMLVLREVSFVDRPWIRGFPLSVNAIDNTFERLWHEDDLTRHGEFSATIRILFESGRYMTVEAQDDTTIIIHESGVPHAP